MDFEEVKRLLDEIYDIASKVRLSVDDYMHIS